MKRLTTAAVTVGAFTAAGATAAVLRDRRRSGRRRRRGEEIAFGSVHGDVHTVLSADGTLIHAEVDEPDEPGDLTVVLVHGWLCDVDTWHYQRVALAGRVRVVAFDQRGHGSSAAGPVARPVLADLAADLSAVIDALAPSGRVVLVGHSMGGMSIMQLASDRPELFRDRVAGVLLLGTSAGELVRGDAVLKRLGRLVRATGPLLDWGRGFNSYSIVRRWAVGPRAAERHADMSNEMILRAPTRLIVDFYPIFTSLDVFASLETLATVPTVVLAGTEDLITPVKHSRRLAAEIDDASLVLVEGAGHMVPFEAHDRVTEAIEGLLEGAA